MSASTIHFASEDGRPSLQRAPGTDAADAMAKSAVAVTVWGELCTHACMPTMSQRTLECSVVLHLQAWPTLTDCLQKHTTMRTTSSLNSILIRVAVSIVIRLSWPLVILMMCLAAAAEDDATAECCTCTCQA